MQQFSQQIFIDNNVALINRCVNFFAKIARVIVMKFAPRNWRWLIANVWERIINRVCLWWTIGKAAIGSKWRANSRLRLSIFERISTCKSSILMSLVTPVHKSQVNNFSQPFFFNFLNHEWKSNTLCDYISNIYLPYMNKSKNNVHLAVEIQKITICRHFFDEL